MGINIHLKSETGDEIADGGVVDGEDLPEFDDERYPYLRLIDPYGDTVFSHYQVKHAVREELERLAAERPSPGLDLLLAMARRCAAEIRTALWLIGD